MKRNLVPPYMLAPDGAGGGAGAATFESKVLAGVEALTTKQGQILGDVDRCSGDIKKALEDITKLKGCANDQQANMDRFIQRMTDLDNLVRREARASFGSPMQRISADPELRFRFNALVRQAVDQKGDMDRVIRASAPADLVKRALGEDSSPGSTLINNQLADEIYDVLASYGGWSTLGVKRLGTKVTKFPVKTARAVANVILTEGGQISDDSTKAGTSVDLEVEVIAALLNVSMQLLQDAEYDVTSDVLNDFAEAFSYRLDWMAFSADGTADATDGGMTGIFVGGTAADAGQGNITVAVTDLDDWISAMTTAAVGVLTRPCKWWMHPHILAKACLVRDAQKRPIFQTALEAPAPGAIGSILGYPVVRVNAAPSTDSAGQPVAVFGDPMAQVVGIRNDFAFEASDHHKWDYLLRSFRGYGRAGVKIRAATGFGVLKLAGA
jgi:HK97 family phage major capsid protein